MVFDMPGNQYFGTVQFRPDERTVESSFSITGNGQDQEGETPDNLFNYEDFSQSFNRKGMFVYNKHVIDPYELIHNKEFKHNRLGDFFWKKEALTNDYLLGYNVLTEERFQHFSEGKLFAGMFAMNSILVGFGIENIKSRSEINEDPIYTLYVRLAFDRTYTPEQKISKLINWDSELRYGENGKFDNHTVNSLRCNFTLYKSGDAK